MRKLNIRNLIVFYDLIILALVDFFMIVFYPYNHFLEPLEIVIHFAISFASIMSARFIGKIYKQVWRYGGIQCYIRLLVVDGIAFFVYAIIEVLLPIAHIAFACIVSICSVNLLLALAMRMMYRYAYKCGTDKTRFGRLLNSLLRIFSGVRVSGRTVDDSQKIKVAILGAGRVGVNLAEELLSNTAAPYVPVCFVDSNKDKCNRTIHGLSVFYEGGGAVEHLLDVGVQEIVFAIPNIDAEERKRLYENYVAAGFKVKVYDYPMTRVAGERRRLREFDTEELLFRKPIVMLNDRTRAYYNEKTVLVTGGGGSIGSELARQLAKMCPKKIILLDIYENGVYDIQQELRIGYGNKIDLAVEIMSITNERGMRCVFEAYHPDIVINAAAHKHVPLMEHNVVEAVENNVFGTLTLVKLCEEFGTSRFMMVSTDKAVNPTNVMGATKRMCEMIVQSYSTFGRVKYSMTRFGNVLGSAGSVVPLFKKQIAAGGPITLTDKRIIRYFMTIPEATQLVLESGAMAENGELFVLDMGQPVKIYDLAKNMIHLSGMSGIEIVETRLRPGEKLYEELLVRTEELDKTENELIFIERDVPCEKDEIEKKLESLAAACRIGDEEARLALRQVVPTYKTPEEINANAENSEEMKNKKELATV